MPDRAPGSPVWPPPTWACDADVAVMRKCSNSTVWSSVSGKTPHHYSLPMSDSEATLQGRHLTDVLRRWCYVMRKPVWALLLLGCCWHSEPIDRLVVGRTTNKKAQATLFRATWAYVLESGGVYSGLPVEYQLSVIEARLYWGLCTDDS